MFWPGLNHANFLVLMCVYKRRTSRAVCLLLSVHAEEANKEWRRVISRNKMSSHRTDEEIHELPVVLTDVKIVKGLKQNQRTWRNNQLCVGYNVFAVPTLKPEQHLWKYLKRKLSCCVFYIRTNKSDLRRRPRVHVNVAEENKSDNLKTSREDKCWEPVGAVVCVGIVVLSSGVAGGGW